MSYLIFGLALTGVKVRKDWCLVSAVCHLHPNIEKKKEKRLPYFKTLTIKISYINEQEDCYTEFALKISTLICLLH